MLNINYMFISIYFYYDLFNFLIKIYFKSINRRPKAYKKCVINCEIAILVMN